MIIFDKQKDKVAIVAPSSAFKNDKGSFDLELSRANLAISISLFEEQGFSCVYDEKIFARTNLEYFAAPKEERLRQLKNALEDEEVKIISMIRGGYGAGEIVFDCMNIKSSYPKILIGYSDVTALHFLFNQHYSFPSIHGAVTEKNRDMMGNIVSILSGEQSDYILQPQNDLAGNKTNIRGAVGGGNLTLICNMIGTALHPDFKDKIILLEDVNEKGYCVHRHLLHMHNAGLFEGVKSVIFADFTESDNLIDASLKDFIENYLQVIPVFKTTGIGHAEKNYPIVFGVPSVISNLILNVQNPFKMVL